MPTSTRSVPVLAQYEVGTIGMKVQLSVIQKVSGIVVFRHDVRERQPVLQASQPDNGDDEDSDGKDTDHDHACRRKYQLCEGAEGVEKRSGVFLYTCTGAYEYASVYVWMFVCMCH